MIDKLLVENSLALYYKIEWLYIFVYKYIHM